MKWQDMSNDRLYYQHSAGFFVIKPKDADDPIPLFCPKCKEQMRTVEDAHVYRKNGCCSSC